MTPTTTLTVKADTSQAVSEIGKLTSALEGLDPKTGWRTTEFWVTVLTHVAVLVSIIWHRDFSAYVPAAAIVAAAVATGVYSLSRARVKAARTASLLAAPSGFPIPPGGPAVSPDKGA